MKLSPPMLITSRLLPGVKIGPVTISLDPDSMTAYFDHDPVDSPEEGGGIPDSETVDDFRPAPGIYHDQDDGAIMASAMAALLGFLEAFSEARHPLYGGENHEQYNLFPDSLGEWAYQFSDDPTRPRP